MIKDSKYYMMTCVLLSSLLLIASETQKEKMETSKENMKISINEVYYDLGDQVCEVLNGQLECKSKKLSLKQLE